MTNSNSKLGSLILNRDVNHKLDDLASQQRSRQN